MRASLFHSELEQWDVEGTRRVCRGFVQTAGGLPNISGDAPALNNADQNDDYCDNEQYVY